MPRFRQLVLSPFALQELNIITIGGSPVNVCLIRRATSKPSISGIIASKTISRKGRPAACAAWRTSIAAVPESEHSTSTRQFCSVADDERAQPVEGCQVRDILPWSRVGGAAENDRETERAAGTHLAGDADSASHHSNQTNADRQPQACSPVLARHGTVGLCERLKDNRLFFRRNADPCIADRETQT